MAGWPIGPFTRRSDTSQAGGIVVAATWMKICGLGAPVGHEMHAGVAAADVFALAPVHGSTAGDDVVQRRRPREESGITWAMVRVPGSRRSMARQRGRARKTARRGDLAAGASRVLDVWVSGHDGRGMV